jgi:hypothetical protein
VLSDVLSLLDEFKDVIGSNNAVGKKSFYGVYLFLISFQDGVAFQHFGNRAIGAAGVEKHHTAADVVEESRAESECG